jgi:hypothetical protein
VGPEAKEATMTEKTTRKPRTKGTLTEMALAVLVEAKGPDGKPRVMELEFGSTISPSAENARVRLKGGARVPFIVGASAERLMKTGVVKAGGKVAKFEVHPLKVKDKATGKHVPHPAGVRRATAIVRGVDDRGTPVNLTVEWAEEAKLDKGKWTKTGRWSPYFNLTRPKGTGRGGRTESTPVEAF